MIAAALRPARNGLALLALSAGPLLAQVDGKVIGVVSDRDTSRPLVGAQVVVEGTNIGNVSNADGHYFINNVPVGRQRITGQFLGYATVSREEWVLAGQTTTINFALPGAMLEAEAIMALVELEPLVIRDNTVSKARFKGEEARAIPADDLDAVIALGAGVYEAEPPGCSPYNFCDVGSGFVVRGGRATETAIYVDGALVTDFANQLNATGIGTFAVEEVDVVTGGFSAEFGHAQSGIVNIVTTAGSREVHGSVRFTTDGRFGTDGYDMGERDAFAREPCCGFNQLQASLGGPVLPGKLTFFGSLEATGAADIDPRAAGFNPVLGSLNSSGSTATILPGNRGDLTRLQGKLAAFPTASSRLNGTYLFSRDQRGEYNTGLSIFDQHRSSFATRLKASDLILDYEQRFLQTPERNLILRVRGNYHQTELHTGTPRNALSAAEIESERGTPCGAECEADGDPFKGELLNYRFGDIEFFFEDSMPGTVFDLPRLSNGPDPVFGVGRIWFDGGFDDRFNHRNERRYGVRVDLDSQLNRVHRLKAGIEWTWINLFTRAGFLGSTGGADASDVDPRVSAAYVQHRLDYGDLVIDLGLRWDHWNPNALFPALPGLVDCSIAQFPTILGCADGEAITRARTRDQLAPRIGVAHPITDHTQVRLSYGKFHQLPELQHFFARMLSDNRQTFVTFRGNPRLDYVETTAFEVGITHLISENMVLDVVGYNRDRRGAIRTANFQRQTIDPRVGEVNLFVNGDNGNIKGVDISLSKRFAHYWATDLAWSLQWARGTTSSPTAFVGSGFGLQFDPLFPGRLLAPPTEQSAEDFDRLHTFEWQLNVGLPGDFRAGTWPGALLRDLSMYLVYSAHSGEPFTLTSPSSGQAREDFNASRLPWYHSGDVRVTKGFALSQALQLDLFLLVKNFLDIRNVLAVHSDTGSPDLAGFEHRESRTPHISVEFKTLDAPDGFPLPLEEIRPEFRERLARQDLDGDGMIALEEAQEALRRALIASSASPFHYGEPRQVRFGVELRF